MDDFELKRTIYDYIKEICHYSQMQVFATSSYQRNYFQQQIDDTINGFIHFLLERDELVKQQHQLAGQVALLQQEEQRGRSTKPPGDNTEQPPGGLVRQLAADAKSSVTLTSGTACPRRITQDELAWNDGSDGRNAYIAVNGMVYDVSAVPQWSGGMHYNGLRAGHDLTDEFTMCHNDVPGILGRLPVVGVLEDR